MAEQAPGQVVNSAGTLVSAIMESLGYHYQAHLLDKLTAPMTEEIGALLYIFGIALAVLMAATQGSYKMSVWLLIGPPLFFASILPRGDIGNASWRFGRQIRDDKAVEKEKNEALEENGQHVKGKAQVSKLFAAFVKMVSVTQQEIVHVISSKRRESDLSFVVRAEMFSQIHIGQFNKPGLERLFHYGMLGKCGDALEFARAMNDPLYRPANFANPRFEKNQQDLDAQEAKKFFESRRNYFKEKYEEAAKTTYNVDAEEAGLIAAAIVKKGGDAFHDKTEQLIGTAAYSCTEIWQLLLYFIQEQAGQDLERILSRGAQLGVSREAIINIMKQAHGLQSNAPTANDGKGTEVLNENDLLAVKRILAKYLMRNEYRKDSMGSWLAHWVSGTETQDIRMRFAGKESFTEQARTAAQEWSEKERMINAAATIPYYQGLALYALAATFPFFALLLLIPGKQAGFCMWFMLWIWIKSWDIAMAVVMLLDDVVFAILSVQKQKLGIVQGQTELQSFDLAIASINEMDPTFQLSTYYTIIATAILAIPPTTAHVILGGLKGGANLISAGLERNSMQASSQFLGAVEQNAVNALRNDFFELKSIREKQYTDNIKAGRGPYDGVRDEKGRLINPLAANPAQAPAFWRNHFGGYRPPAPSGANQRPELGSFTPLKGELATRSDTITDNAGRSGYAGGIAGPKHRFGEMGSPALVGIMAKATTIEDRRIRGMYGKDVGTLESEYAAMAAGAIWDAEIEPLQLHRVNLMSLMGALAIPSPNFALSYAGAEAQEKFIFKQYEQTQAAKIAAWQVKADVASSFREFANMVLQPGFDPERAKEEGIISAADLEKLDAGTRNAIKKDYMKLSAAGGSPSTLTMDQARCLSDETKKFLSWKHGNFLQGKATMNGAIMKNMKAIGAVTATGIYGSKGFKEVANHLYGDAYGKEEDLDNAVLAPTIYDTGSKEGLKATKGERHIQHQPGNFESRGQGKE